VERVLGTAITRAFAFEFAVRLLVGFGLLQRRDLAPRSAPILPAHSWPPPWQLLHGLEIVTLPHAAHPGRRDTSPRLRSSLATWTWAQAGCSGANSTTACLISSATRFFITSLRREISCSAPSLPLS
jgi:hypothetical protein